uniref:C2H2-type domain-containing protein n=1 Tax=Steinernema glaseri TaxID=37863 RepID=A0A1I7Z2Q9_9BILA
MPSAKPSDANPQKALYISTTVPLSPQDCPADLGRIRNGATMVNASEEATSNVAVEKAQSDDEKASSSSSDGTETQAAPVKRKADAEVIDLGLDEDDDDDIVVLEEPNAKKAKVESPIPDDPESKPKDDKADEQPGSSTSNGASSSAATSNAGTPAPAGSTKKEPELTSSEALLDRLEVYIGSALDKKDATNRKVLDALLAAINVQVQKEPLSVRKLILEKQLVLPNTISFPPSQVVDLLIEHDPDHSLARVIAKMFGEERPKLTENERRERQLLKATFPAPHMTKMAADIGFELVQEATYADIIYGRNLPEIPKNMETYKQVASQLKPIWETLKKKNEPYKLKLQTCRLCKFQTENSIVMSMHQQTPHFDGRKYSCGYCEEFDTNEGRIQKHYIDVHQMQPLTREEPPAKNPCGICDEDFAYKGQRDAHMRTCKKNAQKLRTVMAPVIPDHVSMFNRWLWEKPPVDASILQQQQQAANQQQKQKAAQEKLRKAQAHALQQKQRSNQIAQQQQRLAQMLASSQQKSQLTSAQAQALIQQQLLATQKKQQQQQQQQQLMNTLKALQAANPTMNLNLHKAAIAAAAQNPQMLQALQQQLQRVVQQQQLTQSSSQSKTPKANNSKKTLPPNSTARNQATPSALPPPAAQQLCEICDQNVQDRGRYLSHLQLFHRQMTNKTDADMQSGAPLACSRCRERFWTYEGLERHLVMSHGLVTSDLLTKAQRKEDGGRCKICSKQYAFNMLQHLVADHDVKLCSAEIMYSCDVCTFRCSSYQKLEHHLNTTHPKTTAR